MTSPDIKKPSEGAWRQGRLLVLHRGAVLPNCCARCAAPSATTQTVALRWHEPFWYWTLLLGGLPYVFVDWAVSESLEVTVGLCDEHRRSRTSSILTGWFIGVVGLLAAGAGFTLPTLPAVIAWTAGAVLVLFGLLFWFLAQTVNAVRIDARVAVLRGCGEAYLALLPDLPADGAPSRLPPSIRPSERPK